MRTARVLNELCHREVRDQVPTRSQPPRKAPRRCADARKTDLALRVGERAIPSGRPPRPPQRLPANQRAPKATEAADQLCSTGSAASPFDWEAPSPIMRGPRGWVTEKPLAAPAGSGTNRAAT